MDYLNYPINFHVVCVGTLTLEPCNFTSNIFQGPVVQSWVSANPGLKFNLSVCLPKGTKTSIDIDKISDEIFPGL